MAQRQLVIDQAARQNVAPSTSTSSPSLSEQQRRQRQRQRQQQQQQQQQPRRHDGRFPAIPPSSAPRDPSVELTHSAYAPTESWVEVASQPSSSSLSSIGDEIVTTGLQVGNPYQYQHPQNQARRRRRLHPAPRSLPRQQTAPPASGTSSQEEYDESDSDSADDRVLASSAEDMIHSPSSADEAGIDSDDDDDNDNNNITGDDDDDGDDATALGRATDNKGRPTFEPQPNAFSHPPAPHPGRRSYSTDAAMAPMEPHPHSGFARRSFPGRSQARAQRGPSFMSPSVREDNDAALRASLTTLLSCAAAARGLPKPGEDAADARPGAAGNGVGPSNQPMELHFVPEAELMEETKASAQAASQAQAQAQAQAQEQAQLQTQQGRPRQENAQRASPTRSSPKPQSETPDNNNSKRPVPDSRSARATKKKRAAVAAGSGTGTGQQGVVADETLISPTLLTWVVSAGVVVLVSVVGFSAGYVIGREVGRQESLAASIGGGFNDTASASGREVMRSSGGSLRRFKWGAVGRSIVAAA